MLNSMHLVLLIPIDAPGDDDEAMDPTFDLDSSMRSDTAHQFESFSENWMLQMDGFLVHNLKVHLGKGGTGAADLAGMMVGI